MKKLLRLTSVLSVVLLAEGAAYASSITIYDSTLGSWTVSWNDYRVSLLDQTPGQSETNPIQTTNLTKAVVFDQLLETTPVVLTFTEDHFSTQDVGGTGSPGGAAGLNFVLLNVIFNNTSFLWSAFDEALADHDLFQQGALITPSPPPSTGSNAHPAKAHFHTPVVINPNPAPWVVVGSPNAGTDLLLSQPPNLMGNGGAELDFTVRIHDILGNDFKRSFDLRETPSPVPEPATLTLLAGGVGMLFARRRRKNP